MTLPEVADALVVRPGDTLILRVAGHLTDEDADRMRARLADLAPGVQLVLVSGVDQMLVYRPDAEAVK